ncbi:MAG: RNA-binding S4 domain-containing protein [Terriglobales bacterium]
MRLDKWLWAARFFKTRALASRACDLGRVLVAGQPAKPARELRGGEALQITTEGGVFGVEVVGLSEVRGPAEAAQKLYRESEESREQRARAAAERRAPYAGAPPTPGRPSKRDRRRLQNLRGRS